MAVPPDNLTENFLEEEIGEELAELKSHCENCIALKRKHESHSRFWRWFAVASYFAFFGVITFTLVEGAILWGAQLEYNKAEAERHDVLVRQLGKKEGHLKLLE